MTARLRQPETILGIDFNTDDLIPYRWVHKNDNEFFQNDPTVFEIYVKNTWIEYPSIAFDF